MKFEWIIEAETRSRVLAWTTRPLQFGSRPDQRAYADRLRDALADLVPTGELTAVIETRIDGFDAENVLFYNVGTSAFKGLCDNGLSFIRRRAQSEVVPSYVFAKPWPVLTQYQTGPRPPLLPRGPAHLQFEFDLPRLNTSTKPHDVWPSAREAVERTRPKPLECGNFGLRLHLGYPSSPSRPNTVGALKPLLDGIISALHSHVPDPSTADAVERLETLCHSTRVRDLIASDVTVLPARRLIKPFSAHGVQWNPADDVCDIVEASWRATGSTSTVRCTVEIFALRSTPKHDHGSKASAASSP